MRNVLFIIMIFISTSAFARKVSIDFCSEKFSEDIVYKQALSVKKTQDEITKMSGCIQVITTFENIGLYTKHLQKNVDKKIYSEFSAKQPREKGTECHFLLAKTEQFIDHEKLAELNGREPTNRDDAWKTKTKYTRVIVREGTPTKVKIEDSEFDLRCKIVAVGKRQEYLGFRAMLSSKSPKLKLSKVELILPNKSKKIGTYTTRYARDDERLKVRLKIHGKEKIKNINRQISMKLNWIGMK